MADYNTCYNQSFSGAPFGSYDTGFMSPKPTTDRFGLDVVDNDGYNDSWNMYTGSLNPQSLHAHAPVEHMNTIAPQGGWQQRPDYPDVANPVYMNEMDTAYLGQIVDNPGHSSQSLQQGGDLFINGLTMSSPVTINPAYANQHPRGWDSDLSVTPPNEYHSSGSDEGSDDFHSSEYLSFDTPTDPGSSRQGSASPSVGTVTVPPLPEPVKPSYYRNRLEKIAPKAQALVNSVATPKVTVPTSKPACTPSIVIQKKKKSCSNCKRRKVGCGGAAPGHKCNQCERTGAECDIAL